MDYGELDAVITDLGEAITLAGTLSGQLTDAIILTDVGTISTLQTKIDDLKVLLETAKTAAEGAKGTMQGIETEVKG